MFGIMVWLLYLLIAYRPVCNIPMYKTTMKYTVVRVWFSLCKKHGLDNVGDINLEGKQAPNVYCITQVSCDVCDEMSHGLVRAL